jgi:tRNA(Arg) A34 adenosine deaminase TadA
MNAADVLPADLAHLRATLALAHQARAHGNVPFGALLVDAQQQMLLAAENTAITTRDLTGHAELNLVRQAVQLYERERLASATIYSNTEPCAMCAAAIHWSGIGRVVFALSAADFYTLVGPSVDHLHLSCREVFAHTGRAITVVGPVAALDDEAKAVHAGI